MGRRKIRQNERVKISFCGSITFDRKSDEAISGGMVLNDVSLEVSNGITGILGVNGVGKVRR